MNTPPPLKVSGGGLGPLTEQVEQGQAGPAIEPKISTGGPAVPAWVKPADLEAAEQAEAAELEALQEHFEGAPASPEDYVFLPTPPGQEPISPENQALSRGVAGAMGLSAGEFRKFQQIKLNPPHLGEKELDKAIERVWTDAERRHGLARAEEIVGFVADVIAATKPLGEYAHRMIVENACCNLALFTFAAGVGERRAKK